MSINIKTKKKEILIISRSFFTKKFQGLGILFDCDVAQGFVYGTVLVITIKLLFFGFWLSIDTRLNKPSIKFSLDDNALVKVLERVGGAQKRSI